MASIINVDTIQTTSGSTVIANGYPKQSGQVIEYLSGVCDGGIMIGLSGKYLTQNANTQQSTTASYADITGSSITYVPPSDAKQVVYQFNFSLYSVTTHDIVHFKFFIDGTEVVYARHCLSGQYIEMRNTFEWIIPIGGIANTNTGRQSSWTTPKTLKMQTRYYGGSNYSNLHGTRYWDGSGSNQVLVPTISIMAIA